MKWLIGALLLTVALVVAYGAYAVLVVNPRVVAELRDNPHGERAREVLLLTFADGRTIPVNYLREDGLLYLGADGPWWRAFRDGAPAMVEVQGERLAVRAEAVLDDPARTADVFSRLRPAAPGWLPDWMNGRLVVLTPRAGS